METFFEILLALWWIWLPALVVWYIVSKDNKSKSAKSSLANQDINQLWQDYILSFKDVVKSKAEKNLIEALLERKTADQLYQKSESPKIVDASDTVSAVLEQGVTQPTIVQEPKSKQQMDSTLLLLYFGAFLLIAAAGLFVAIGNMEGMIRTFVLALTTFLLYAAGAWIFQNKPKLSQAGLSFMGAALVITPLIGVAWYNLIAEQQNGGIIWLITSLACIVLYTHAYLLARNEFMAYLLIGSFLSSLESAIFTINMPAYIFVWAAIALGVGLQIFNIYRGKDDKSLSRASDNSAQIIIPLSLLVSVLILGNFGSLQLGVSLLLAGMYYALLAWQKTEKTSEYSTTAQAAVIAGLASIGYSLGDSPKIAAAFLGATLALYGLVCLRTRREWIRKHNLAEVGAMAAAGSMVMSIFDAWPLVIYLSISTLFAGIIWLKMESRPALATGGVILLILPFVAGQYAISSSVSALQQTALFSIPFLVLGLITYLSCNMPRLKQYYDLMTVLYMTASIVLIGCSWLAGFSAVVAVSLATAAGFSVVRYASKENGWWIAACAAVSVPAVFALIQYGIDDQAFSLMTGVSLLLTIAISLLTREKTVRWFVVSFILLTPLAIGGGGLDIHWGTTGYSIGYLVAMCGCILARAIARGKLLLSNNVPVSSYDSSSSQAYIAGYIFAAFTAFLISLSDTNSQILTTAISAFILLSVFYLAYRVEGKTEALLLIPILLQIVLFSALRPNLSDGAEVGLAAVLSAIIGACSYAAVALLPRLEQWPKKLLAISAVATAYIGPSLYFLAVPVTIWLPVSLAIAGSLTLYHNCKNSTVSIEWSAAIVLASISWFLYVIDVKNIHIHTHLLAIFLALFAWLYYVRGDRETSRTHVVGLFLVATVPLILQALGGENGGMYGLLLIVQQAGFMIAGIITNQRFLIKAGLWVALAAVLYQLRGLGWAFVAIVAVVLISVAVYRLQRSDNTKP